jgi:hypothetical protein
MWGLTGFYRLACAAKGIPGLKVEALGHSGIVEILPPVGRQNDGVEEVGRSTITLWTRDVIEIQRLMRGANWGTRGSGLCR